MQGYTKKEMLKIATRLINTIGGAKGFKICQGNKNNLFYIITPGDRDFNSPFSVAIEDFIAGEMPAESAYLK